MTKTERTQQIIDYYRGLPDEFGMLKGLICATHAMTHADAGAFRELIATAQIAARMDELLRAQNEECLRILAESADLLKAAP